MLLHGVAEEEGVKINAMSMRVEVFGAAGCWRADLSGGVRPRLHCGLGHVKVTINKVFSQDHGPYSCDRESTLSIMRGINLIVLLMQLSVRPSSAIQIMPPTPTLQHQ